MFEASDEWWTRKIAVSSLYIIVKIFTVYNFILLCSNYWLSTCRHVPMQKPWKIKVCQIMTSWTSCLEARLQQGKMRSTQAVKYQRKPLEGLRTLLVAQTLLTPNVNPLWMLMQWRLKVHNRRGQDQQWLRGKAWQPVSTFSSQFARNQEKSVQLRKRCPTL